MAHDTVLPAGRVLGLVLTVSDAQYTVPTTTGATVEVDLGRSRLGLPVSLAARRDRTGGNVGGAAGRGPDAEGVRGEAEGEYGLIPQG